MSDNHMLIVGAGGQLGLALQEKYPAARTATQEQLDIASKSSVENFDWSGVDVIINVAAYTQVDAAETDEGRRAAWQVNADGVANLTAAAAQFDAILVHISTDYVFDGSREEHDEQEPFAPLSVYGASKAAGDVAASLAPKHYILRTSWVIGEGKNFVRTMLGLGQKGVSPTVVADQVGRLTFTTELVRAIDHLLDIKAPFGTYNVSNAGRPASWAEITRRIFALGDFDLSVTDTTTAEYFAAKEQIAPRPLHSTLSLAKLQATGFTSTDWEADLESYIKKELAS